MRVYCMGKCGRREQRNELLSLFVDVGAFFSLLRVALSFHWGLSQLYAQPCFIIYCNYKFTTHFPTTQF